MYKTTNLIVCFIAVLCTLLAFTVTAQVQHTSETPVKGNVNDINDKVLRLKGSEQGPIGELVDSILTFHVIAQQVLGGTNGLRDQIVRAEAGYQSGARRGVPESDVARLINGLAAHFNTPEYTRTSQEEIRQLRVQLMPMHPRLIGLEPAFKGNTRRANGFGR